ncbi:MAG: L-glyceraldehyde 3-phosphate reductase [Bacteroidales bacterium]|nr:L-glyceraldehyde 3-phosphate reductase [Bacteroidales bacterium]
MKPSPYRPNEKRYESGMIYKRTGNSGILLPAISLGLWHNFGSVDRLADGLEKAHYAFDQGITHFDLANNYGPVYGSAEETFGLIMEKSFQPFRDELFISTKAGYDMWPGPYGNWGSRKYLMSSLDQSLLRMKLEYVDLFYSHRYDPNTPLQETMQTLVDMVKQGKALYIGISNYPTQAAIKAYQYLAERDVPCLLHQGKYNLFQRMAEEDDLLNKTSQAGVGFIAYSPLAQGLLTDRYLEGIPYDSRIARGGYLKKEQLTKKRLQQISKLNDMAKQRGQTLAEMSIAWLLNKKEITSVLIGASSTQQIENNLKALHNTSFSEEELQFLESISKE